uniref:Uncharacterized protein n=1 Tax=Trichinella nativa TaxID=6335 RepID=A0A0V1KHD0_9BILA
MTTPACFFEPIPWKIVFQPFILSLLVYVFLLGN